MTSEAMLPGLWEDPAATTDGSGDSGQAGAADSGETALEDAIAPEQYRITRIQVYNWGTFSGHHECTVPREGLLLTGHSGSGKSSLLDALSTVLVAPKDVQYNVAAQDATASDRSRSALSYVRGAYRRTADDVTGELRTEYLRTGATRSAIALTFERLEPADTVTLVRLFHVRAGGSSSADLRYTHLIAEGSLDLTQVLAYAQRGLDTRAIKREMDNVTVHDRYESFAARFRRRLGLTSPVAQRLLHKTQSAKNLASLDVLLRDFMLDEPTTFGHAKAAVEQFGELRQAHESVVETRQQQEALLPLRQDSADIEEAQAEAAAATALLGALPEFITDFKVRTYRERRQQLEREGAELRDRLDSAQQAEEEASTQLRQAQRTVDGMSDAGSAALEAQLESARKDLARTEQTVKRLAEPLGVLGAALPRSLAEFEEFAQTVTAEMGELRERRERYHEEAYPLHEQKRHAEQDEARLRSELEQIQRSRSAMPTDLLTAREIIASQLGVSLQTLPYVGEVIEMVPGSERWRVAAEAVAGGFARTMIVPDHLYRQVAKAVDTHHLNTLLVYERVLPGSEEPRSLPREALAHHLRPREKTVLSEEVAGWLHHQIDRRFTHLCVEDAEALAEVDRGVTLAGQVKESISRHRKDDRRPHGSARTWIIGINADQRIAALQEEAAHAAKQKAEAEAALNRLEQEQRLISRRLDACSRLHNEMRWEEINLAQARQHVDSLSEQLRQTHASRPDLAHAQASLAEAQQAWTEARSTADDLRTKLGAVSSRLTDTERQLARLEQITPATSPAGDSDQSGSTNTPTNEAERTALREQIAERAKRGRRHLDVEIIDEVSGQLRTELVREREQATSRQARAELHARHTMQRFNERWSAYAASLQPELAYMPDYLAALDSLQADDLPRHEARFRRLLTEQTQQNVGQLATVIREAPRHVIDRIAPVNEALRQVEYAPGRHLRIEVSTRRFPEVDELLKDLQRLSSHSLGMAEETIEQADERFDRLNALMTRLASSEPADITWRRKCLDTRRHVTFRAIERDAAGNPVNYYEGASGLSGGQRQKLVIFCLAAALRYQLTDLGETAPSYALVVLDEAFDKTDAEFTRAGLAVFRDFGFQLLLATPMTKIQIMEDYVGGAAVVTNSAEGSESQIHAVLYDEVPAGGAAPAEAGGEEQP